MYICKNYFFNYKNLKAYETIKTHDGYVISHVGWPS